MKRRKHEKIEVNRFARAWFACPFCHAKAGERCTNTDSTLRDRTHNERYTIALRTWRYQDKLQKAQETQNDPR